MSSNKSYVPGVERVAMMRQYIFLVFAISSSGFKEGGEGVLKILHPRFVKIRPKNLRLQIKKYIMPPEAVDQSDAG